MKPENVKCPTCDGRMVPKMSATGAFWGCKAFPQCRGTRNADGESRADRFQGNTHEDYEEMSPSERQRSNDRRRW